MQLTDQEIEETIERKVATPHGSDKNATPNPPHPKSPLTRTVATPHGSDKNAT